MHTQDMPETTAHPMTEADYLQWLIFTDYLRDRALKAAALGVLPAVPPVTDADDEPF